MGVMVEQRVPAWTLAIMMAMAVLAPQAAAQDPLAKPLPPTNVEADWQGNGTLLTWDAPAMGTEELTGYAIYRIDHGSRERVATVAADVQQHFVASDHPDLFWITSLSGQGESAPSLPATAYPHCNAIELTPPDVQPQCLFPLPIVRCDILTEPTLYEACRAVLGAAFVVTPH